MDSAPRSITEILECAGGAVAIARESDGEFTADAVYKWPKIGIPDRHWPLIMRLAPPDNPITPTELFKANLAARSPERAAS